MSLKPPLYMMRIHSTDDPNGRDNITHYALCDMTGETIMMNTDKNVCRDVMRLCNKNMRYADDDFLGLVCQLCVEIEPMEKPLSQIVTLDKKGNEVVAISPMYRNYVKRFAEIVKASDVILPEKPIDYRCQVIVKAYSSNTIQKSIPAYVESTLDCLVEAKILKNKSYKIVNNIDGSRIFCDEKRPRIQVMIRQWKGRVK